MSGVLVVFAKRPEPGAVKTRLCPPFTPEEAAAFYAEMLADVIETSAAVAARCGLAPVLAVHPPDSLVELAALAPGYRVVAQRGASLAARMQNAVADEAAHRHLPILLRGSDCPTLGADAVEAALAALAQADVVLCPDRDGGYHLVGLAHDAPGLFDHPMSTSRVLDDTLTRARALGLDTRVLAPGFDVDTAADLALLAEARAAGRATTCPRTLAWLDRHRRWPG